MKVAVGGSRKLPRGSAQRFLVRFLIAFADEYEPDATVLVRAAASGEMQEFEAAIAGMCRAIALPVETRSPKPAETPGRASVFRRDIELVNEADLVLLFFAEEDAEGGYSGTYHLFEKALDDERPVYAWVVDAEGVAFPWGDYDPRRMFTSLLQRA